MSAAAEAPFAYAFAALLALGSAVLLFVPLFRHLSDAAAGRRAYIASGAGLAGLGIAAVAVIGSASSNPTAFLPVAAGTVVLRIASPSLLYRGVRDRFEAERTWPGLRIGIAVVFVGLAALLTYNLVNLLAGATPHWLAGLSEQCAMAFGTSFLIVRMALRFRPRFTGEILPLWFSATAIALAFVVVAPYAFPSFAIPYAASGLAGWLAGVIVLRYVD